MSNKEKLTSTEKFYRNVQVEATRKGKSLIKVSMDMGKTPSTIATMKSRGVSPTLDTIVAIAKAIPCKLEDLLEDI